MWSKKLEKIFRSSIIVILIASLGVNYPAFAQPTNLGFAVPDFDISGNNVVFIVDELEQGATDLNGDGDMADLVLHTFVIGGGSPINHGLAVDSVNFFIDGNNVVFAVDEASQTADLNSDGDMVDFVLFTFVFGGGSPINHGLAIDPFSLFIDGNNVVFEVDEAEQGATDFNSDGDMADFVVHTLVFGDSPINHGLAGTGDTFVSGNNVAFTVDELEQGLTDFNGDGDMADTVLFTLVFGGSPINRGLAVPPFNLGVDGNNVVFVVDEAEQGLTDLNGDGDMADLVIHTFVFGGSITNLGLAATGDFFVLGNNVVFRVDEASENADFNSDGDMADFVIHTFVFGGSITNLGLAVPFFDFFIDGNNVVFEVDEASQTADLNSDGDMADFVIHTFVFGGSTTNLGLGSSVPAISGNNVAFAVNEASENADFNGDGDQADFVIHTFVVGGSPTNLGLGIGGFPSIDGNNVVFLVHEPSENADFNGDGDQADFVIHTFVFGGSPTNLGLGIGGFQLIDGNNVVFLVHEPSENADFNGDGDQADFVIHTFVLTPPSECVIQTALNVDTIISSNCNVTSSVVAGGSVNVQSPAVMTVTSTGTLDIDFTAKNLTVDSGAGVLIEAGGSIT